MIAYLQKSEGSEGFHQIIDFLNASHIQYALIENPTIYVSFIKQFWRTATARTSATGEVELTATIDGQEKTITEASLRRHLKLEDNGGVTTLPNSEMSEIFEQLSQLGTKLSTARLKLSTDSIKIERMELEAMVKERRIFKCWIYNHTTNGHQFTMSNRHQELASPEQTASELASPKQTALGKDISNPLIVDSLLKTIWLSMHHVITMKYWLFQSKWLQLLRCYDDDKD
ncbi:hypothetical protein Tco_0923082 [Tanacetum coccineum]|uniref:Xylulose kinase-1 n=1 Tax=Tanacetum coccineum TaxID=301880 RepID=A0ABQ5D0Z2_9ASTR